MPVFNRNRHSGSSGVAAAYTIDNSCRFNDDDSPATAHTYNAVGSSDKIATLSWWMKLGNLGITRKIFDFDSGQEQIDLHTNDKMRITYASVEALITTQVFRDCGAWYHCVWRIDTTDAAGGDRLRLYVNGSEVTAFDTDSNPTVNTIMGGMGINTNVATVGATQGVANEFDGYLAEVAMCDGQSLGPGSFGETDDNGQWVPKDLSGLTFGNNGFWLDFAVAPGTGNGAGTDVSGNANHFTDTGLAAADKTLDSPSDDADNKIGNYWTWNPLNVTGGSTTLSDGNLRMVATSAASTSVFAPVLPATGKWAWKITATLNNGAGAEYPVLGIVPEQNFAVAQMRSGGTGYGYGADGRKFGVSGNASYGASWSAGDVIEVEWDADNGDLSFIHEGSSQGDAFTGITGRWKPAQDPYAYGGNNDTTTDFGQLGFTPTTAGYKTLMTANLPAPSIIDPSKYFQSDNFSGTGGELARTLTDASGSAVKPDFVWVKDLDSAVEHLWTDSARGATKEINVDSTAAQTTVAEGVKSFDTSGYTLGTDGNYNTSSSPNVAWCWVAGSGAGSSDENGSINTITTTVNTTSKFSVSTYTGTGSAATIGHGIGSKPEFIITKNTTQVEGWKSYHVGTASDPETDYMSPHATDAVADRDVFWNDTAPTSTVFSVGTDAATNGSTDAMVAFCWAGVEGYSKFGAYEGNANADGPFVWLGFRPAFLWIKDIDSIDDWHLKIPPHDTNVVDTYGITNTATVANLTYGGYQIDFLSNGFKMRGTGTQTNKADTHIFMAFAEFPFGGEGVAQARAR
jgi:hypothetical protein